MKIRFSRSHEQTERNQDDFDAGIAVLVELTSEVEEKRMIGFYSGVYWTLGAGALFLFTT